MEWRLVNDNGADLRRVPYEGPDGIAAVLREMTRFGMGTDHRKWQYDRSHQRCSMFDHPRARRAIGAEWRAA
jgi:hypothetical protein